MNFKEKYSISLTIIVLFLFLICCFLWRSKMHDLALITDENYSGYIYFGRDTYPFCLEFNKILKQELKDNSQLTIYKFDTDEWCETEDFQIILDKYEIEGIPALVKVETDKKLTSIK